MQTIPLCTNCVDPDVCLQRFRDALEPLRIEVTLDGKLASIPESVHLHLRPLDQRSGTLEYTMDVRGRRAWLSWHENRYQPWIDEAVTRLRLLGCGD